MSRKINVNEDFGSSLWKLTASRQFATYKSGDRSPHSKSNLVQVTAGVAGNQRDGVFENWRDYREAFADAFG